MQIVSVEEMRFMDRETCRNIVDGRTLMYEAGQGVYDEICQFARRASFDHFLVVCGKGNNGGDGFVIAELLYRSGYSVVVQSLYPINELHGDSKFYAENLSAAVEWIEGFDLPEITEQVIIVDAVLGTGFSGNLRENYCRLIEAINGLPSPVIAVDIPSGLNGDTGTAQPVTVYADETVTIGYPKRGLFVNDALEAVGDLRLVEIAIPDSLTVYCSAGVNALFKQDITLVPRPEKSHKKSFGSVKVIGGSSQYQGAPKLAAAAAMRAGCGYVTLLSLAEVGREGNPLALIHRQLEDFSKVVELIEPKETVVFGPGIGRVADAQQVLAHLLMHSGRVIIDADGLWHLCQLRAFTQFQHQVVLTPHPGEMQHLLGHFLPAALELDRMEQAKALAEKLHCIVVLKGRFTVIAAPDGRCSVNSSGCNALATAGTGDVLAGLIAAFAAEYSQLFQAVETAVFIHGKAGESASCRRSLIADDLLQLIPQVLSELNPMS